jgi:predicted lipoprotein
VLADATAAQKSAWRQFCTSPDQQGLALAKSAFQRAADAWSGIEFVLYGPISADYRFERMAHWPERNNAVSRGLASLLSRSDELTPERFAETSAAVQGLTALERLLYEPDALKVFTAKDAAARRHCDVGTAIANGLAATSRKVLDEWRAPDGTLAKLENGNEGLVDEALTRIVTDHITSLEIISDNKLGAAMGKRLEDARPNLAEGWRSGRSMRAIAINLDANAALTRLLFGPGAKQAESLLDSLQTAQHLAEGLPPDIGKLASDAKQRFRIILLRDAVRSARDLAELSLPDALGVIIGFNSRDGD